MFYPKPYYNEQYYKRVCVYFITLLYGSLTFCTTFYFGVSLTDEPSQEEEMTVASLVGDPDSLLYQPVRDLNADIEKLLEHLPSEYFSLCKYCYFQRK